MLMATLPLLWSSFDTGTLAMALIAAAAWLMIISLMLFSPATSTMEGIRTMSLLSIWRVRSLAAKVETQAFGMPIGITLSADSTIYVPPPPPMPIAAFNPPLATREATILAAPLPITSTANP